MRKYILPYNMASSSASVLASEISALRVRREGSRFVPSNSKIMINWGCPVNPFPNQRNWLNHPYNVKQASDKLRTFEKLSENESVKDFVPYFTTDHYEMVRELSRGKIMVARQVLNGNSGDGIVILDPNHHLVENYINVVEGAPLFVEYKKKRFEYRVHFGCKWANYFIYIQQKARSRSVPDDSVDWRIRNTNNGFIFKEPNMEEFPHPLHDLEILTGRVARALDLDFGAVDIVYNTTEGSLWVLEVNTAPGINSEKTKNFYSAYFNNEVVTEMAGEPYIQYEGEKICRRNDLLFENW